MAGPKQLTSNQEIQDELDRTRADVRYLELTPAETRSGSTVTYLDFYGGSDWEADVVLVNGSYATITPASSDLLTGHWTTSTDPASVLFATGKTYDCYAAAASLLNRQAMRCKDKEEKAGLREQAAWCASQQRATMIVAERSDCVA